MKIDQAVLDAHAQFGGDLETMQKAYEWPTLSAEIERLRTLLSEAEKDARRVALGDAAITHETRVTELRNDPSSYKNGKITKSAKRASDFHERSAAVIRALQSEER